MSETVIFATSSSQYFAEKIAEKLKIEPPGTIFRKSFGDGEKYYCLDIKQRDQLFGKNAIFVASTNRDEDLLEIHRIGSALAAYGTTRRIFVIPFLGYSTMERAVKPGEIATAKKNACLLSSLPNSGLGNVFLHMDLHVAGLIHYYEGDSLRFELYAEETLIAALEELKLTNFMFGSADLGRTKWVETYARRFGTDMAFISKTRSFETTEVLAVIGNVVGKNVIIYDDMTRSAGTIINAAKAYKAGGAKAVYVLLSHLAFNDETVVKKIEASEIQKMIGTNSHPISQSQAVKNSDKIIVKDISGLFVEPILTLLS